MKFYNYLAGMFFTYSLFATPPRMVPEDLLERFTMNHTIPVVDFYFDDSYQSDVPILYLKSDIEKYISKIRKGEPGYYGATDLWLYEALEKYPIKDKEVVIIGSTIPFYESIVLAYGGIPTTIEYNRIISLDRKIKTMTVEQYKKNPKKFDVILSISSIEHDGLGRYGDPINPDGDLEFMSLARDSLLKETGQLILAVPIGQDAVVWNSCRVYGQKRFPLLLKEWNVIQSFGFQEENFTERAVGDWFHQPVFVLTPK